MSSMSRIVASVVFLVASASAQLGFANVTYTYTGNNFTNVVDDPSVPGSYDTLMRISGTFELGNALPPNRSLNDDNVVPLSFSFTDGRSAITNTSPGLNIQTFRVATDATGNITQWNLSLISQPGLADFEIQTRSAQAGGSIGQAYDQGAYRLDVRFSNDDYAYTSVGGSWATAGNTWLWPIQESDQDSRQEISQDYAEFGSIISGNHHTGLDISRPQEPPVVATEDGAIIELQHNDSANKDCTKIPTDRLSLPENKGICKDHGLGNALTIKHSLSNDPTPIYSAYLHWKGFSAELEKQVTKNCTEKLKGIRYECKPDANGVYPVTVKRGDVIGQVGGTGYGRVRWAIHLHFEAQRFGSLLNGSFGYSKNHPDSANYIDPVQLIDGSSFKGPPVVGIPAPIPRMLAKPTVEGVATTTSTSANNFPTVGGGAAKRIGPRMDYSCHIPTPLNLPSPLPHPATFASCLPLKVTDEFIVLQTSPGTPGCSLGWFQIVPNIRDVAVVAGDRRTGGYFSIGDLSQTGTNPDAWICRGDSNIEWVRVLRTADNYLVGDVNKDGAINQTDVDIISDTIPYSTNKKNPTEKCTSTLSVGSTDVRDLNGDAKVDRADLQIAARLCSPLCSIPKSPKCP